MRRQIRNVLLVITAFLLTVLFCFFPNIQSRLTDWKTFGKSENLSLNPVEISVESTQTTLEKLKNRLIYLNDKLEQPEEDKNLLRKNINDGWGKIYNALAQNPLQYLDEDEFLSAHLSLYRKPKESVFSEKIAPSPRVHLPDFHQEQGCSREGDEDRVAFTPPEYPRIEGSVKPFKGKFFGKKPSCP